MVPHLRVEEELERLLGPPEPSETDAETGQEAVRLCVTSVSDPRKGERLIVLHRPMKESAESLRRGLAEAGLPNLYIPSEGSFIEVDEIPLLGTGKLDLKGIQELAQKMVQRRGEAGGDEEAGGEASGGDEAEEK
jgi:acyl-[acyl-carrier-protein]-phospholipid O-acyltransferase / long-chain-fatty-acid--[acyl-carrier-protein] ligase